ncbi:MAG: cation diffusion facilitator family transporter, partial [Acidobacteria bacterium]|nr:cation diffusion facilitator family transporter [Acidobacteriota bacterium]
MATSSIPRTAGMRKEKRSVARNSMLAAIGMTALKIVVGFTSGSLGLISEAAHSSLDLLAAVITFFSVGVSDKPADADHQYGHGKVENFSAFLETGLLLITCVWIVTEAIRRLFFHHVVIEPSALAFGVLFLSMAIDFWRSRALGATATRYKSQALEADALHFTTDIWSSAVVILGLALVWLGHRLAVPWLRVADPIAALAVAGVIVYVSSRLARQTIDALLDAAPRGVRGQIVRAVEGVPGILEVDRVRVRRAGNHYFAEVQVGLSRTATLQHSDHMAAAVTDAVQRVLPEADVTIRAFPLATGGESIFDRIRAVASRHNLSVHDVNVQDLNGKLHVEQHLELDERLSLKQAHDFVTVLESEIRSEVPEIDSILTHIESDSATIEPGDATFHNTALEHKLRKIVAEFPEVIDLHEIVLKRVRDRIYLSCHTTLSDDLSLSRVHDISTALEIRFKQAAP